MGECVMEDNSYEGWEERSFSVFVDVRTGRLYETKEDVPAGLIENGIVEEKLYV